MIRARYVLVARDARSTELGAISVIEIIDRVNVSGVRGEFSMPPCVLVAALEVDSMEGLTHEVTMRVLDGDGNLLEGSEVVTAELQFAHDLKGYPATAAFRLPLELVLPGPGEYTFELRSRGTIVGSTWLVVVYA